MPQNDQEASLPMVLGKKQKQMVKSTLFNVPNSAQFSGASKENFYAKKENTTFHTRATSWFLFHGFFSYSFVHMNIP